MKFNGQKILNLKQLMQLVRTNTEPYLRFDFDDDLYGPLNHLAPSLLLTLCTTRVIIVEAAAARHAEDEILRAHRVPSPMSEDLRSLLQLPPPIEAEATLDKEDLI